MAAITQRDIAAALNLSLKTVQRAFNQPDTVAPSQRERIVEYARRHGYVPNRGARALRSRNRRRMVLFTMVEPSYFWDDVGAGAQAAADQIAHLGFDFEHVRLPTERVFMRRVRRVVREGVDCVALVNHDFATMGPVVEWLTSEGVPFAAFNIDFPPASGRLCFIGPDHEQHGEIAGELIVQMLPTGGTVLTLFPGSVEHPEFVVSDIFHQRWRGMKRILDETPGIVHRVVPIDDAAGCAPECIRTDSPHTTVLYCLHPLPHHLLASLREVPADERPRLIGYDLSPEIVELLAEGIITAEIFQNPALQGYGVVKFMEMHLETGRRPARDRYTITPEIVFSSNANQRSNFDVITEFARPLTEVTPEA